MTRMVIDGLTAALLTPALAREGWTLADFASSLRTAMSGTYQTVRLTQLKRDAEAADFVIGVGGNPTVLEVPGIDAFSPAGAGGRKRGVPPIWGSVLRIDGRLELRPNAIRCHADVLAMPSRAKGRFLITNTSLPETVRIALCGGAVGQPLGRLLSIAGADLPDMPIREVRDARDEDFKRVELTNGTFQLPVGSAPAQQSPQGIVVAVAAGEPISVDAG